MRCKAIENVIIIAVPSPLIVYIVLYVLNHSFLFVIPLDK